MKPIAIMAVLMSVFASVPSWAIDFTGADCDSPRIRKAIAQDYFRIPNNRIVIVDIYDQVTEEAGENKLTCLGEYEFSNGDKMTMRYAFTVNSLGEGNISFSKVEGG